MSYAASGRRPKFSLPVRVRSADDFRMDHTSTNAIAGRRTRNLPTEDQNSVLLKMVNVFNLIKDIPPDPVAGKQNLASEKQDRQRGEGERRREARLRRERVGSPVWTTEGREEAIGDVSPSGEKGEGRFTETQIRHLFPDGESIIFL
jgi:hypothetical protein